MFSFFKKNAQPKKHFSQFLGFYHQEVNCDLSQTVKISMTWAQQKQKGMCNKAWLKRRGE